jgi:hypothetical protein
VAGVRGTIFSVKVDPLGTEVQVYDGEVRLTNGGQEHDVSKQHACLAAADGQFTSESSPAADQAAAFPPDILQPNLSFSPIRLKPRHGRVTVRGSAEPGAVVTVGGQRAEVDANGAFRADAAAPEGVPGVLVVVTDPAGHVRQELYTWR